MSTAKSTPKDAKIMKAILKDMGVSEYEPRVINQMLEFTYRYVTDILDDAKVYSNHASKKNIDVEDVKLSIQCRLDHSFTTPPPRDLLVDVARHKNTTPLPLIKPYTGPKLPPDRYCLAANNFRLKSLKKVRVNVQGGLPSSLVQTSRINIQQPMGGSSNYNKPVSIGSLGGSSISLVTRGVTQPTVTIRTAGSGTQNTTTMPIIRLTGSSNPSIRVQQSSMSQLESLKRKREEDDDYDA